MIRPARYEVHAALFALLSLPASLGRAASLASPLNYFLFQTQALERANDMLLAIKEKIAGKVAQVDIVVESGDARGFIPLYCDKLRADALIIGSRGLGGLKRYRPLDPLEKLSRPSLFMCPPL